jgi:hypothetical protein
MVPVDPDVAVGHDTVELNDNAPCSPIGWKRKMFAIPADAGGQKSARPAGRIGFVKRPFNAPVVRNIKLLPRGVVNIRSFAAGQVSALESPISIERPADAAARNRVGSDQWLGLGNTGQEGRSASGKR